MVSRYACSGAVRRVRRPPDRLLPPVAGRHSKLRHLPHRLSLQPELPGYRTLTPALDTNRLPNTTVGLHLEHPSGVS
jgi:hypothetical protein